MALLRRNLRLRIVLATSVSSLLVLVIVGLVLVNSVVRGLLVAKQQTVLAESVAATNEVQRLMDASDTGIDAPNATRLVDAAITALSVRSGSPGVFDALLLGSSGLVGVPERGTKLVDADSVPASLRDAVGKDNRQVWTYHPISYEDGRTAPGIIVGSPIDVPRVGQYQLFLLYPLTSEEEAIRILNQGVAVTAIMLLLGLGLIVWFVVSRVTQPVREAAEVAERLSEGDLDRRMTVRGEDDLATLAASFNDMAENLQHQIVRLETLSLVQQQFVSDVSHELRTPLTTVRMASELVFDKRSALDRDTARAAELLFTQVQRLEGMLSDLLEISRVDAGAALLETAETDIGALVAGVVSDYLEIASRSGVLLRTNIPSAPVVAEVDPRRVSRIVRNLVANAIEHAERKPVEIQVVPSAKAISVSVRDYGAGMSPAETERVFDRFWRADPARKRTLGGTGLGLSISADDARLHGGEIEVWSARGRGANFVLQLPLSPESDLGSPAIHAGERRA